MFGAAEYVLPGRTWAGISTADGEIPAQKRHCRGPAQNDGSGAGVVCRLSLTRDHRMRDTDVSGAVVITRGGTG